MYWTYSGNVQQLSGWHVDTIMHGIAALVAVVLAAIEWQGHDSD